MRGTDGLIDIGVLAAIPLAIKIVAMIVSIGMFFWESGTADHGYLAANIGVLVINACWIAYDAKEFMLFGLMWALAWIMFVLLQFPLLYVKHPGLYLAIALSSRAVAVYVKRFLL
jgi:hypothetical protein